MIKKQFFTHNGLIFLILFLGVFFRFLPLFYYQFSHDELSALSRTIFPDFWQTVNYGVMFTDTHPILIQVFLWLWVKIVGYSEVGVKMPFLISGVLSVWYIYRFSLEFFNKQTALIASTIVSCSFIFLLYSSYARMYAPGVLFSILLLINAYKLCFSSSTTYKQYVYFALWALLSAYNNHLNCFFAFIVAITVLIYLPKHQLKNYLITCFFIILFYLPHLPITLHQLSIGGIGASAGGWLSEPRNNEIIYFIKTLFGTGWSGIIISGVLFSFLFISAFKLIPFTKKQAFLFWVFIINYFVIHIYSVFKNPILQNSVLLFSGIALIVFLASFSSFVSVKRISLLCLFFVFLMSFQTVQQKNYFSKVHVQDFESQVKTTLEVSNQYGNKDVYSLYKAEPFFVYVYEKKFNSIIPHKNLFDSVFSSLPNLNNFVRNLKQSFIVLGGLSAGEIQVVKQYYPFLISHQEDYFRNITVLSKNKLTAYDDVSVLDIIKPINSELEVFVQNNKQLCFFNDSLFINVNDSDGEFPVSFTLPLINYNCKSGQFLIAELTLQTDSFSNINTDRLCSSISDELNHSVFYKEVLIKDFIKVDKSRTTVFLEVFLNDQLHNWKRKHMKLNFFIWKDKVSNFKVLDFKIKRADYNPTKWQLWQ